MGICKSKIIFLILFLIFFNSNFSKADLSSIKFSPQNLIKMKYDIFFLKNKKRVENNSQFSFMIRYEYLDHKVEIIENNEIKINIYAYMNVVRYKKQKKYIPKIVDCNVVRNKLLLNKHGYNLFTYKKNYKVSEDLLYKSIKENIYDFSGLSEKEIKKLTENTLIKINIIHPISKFNISCSGKISDLELI